MSVGSLLAIKDEKCSPLKLCLIPFTILPCLWVVFLYCQDLLQLYSVFSSILFGNGLIAHIFFCHHLPISQFLLLIHFLISWVFVIKYILQEKLSVLYSPRSFFSKYVCFYLHDTMPGKIFFSPNFFTSELCFTFLHQFSGTGYCCGEECDANLSLFFSFVHDLVLCLWKYFKLNKWIRSFLGLRLPYLIILIRIWGVIITLLSLAVLRNSLLASL